MGSKMRLVTTREASRLTGLSTNKLREWTSRRALIPADVPPKSQGSPARYSWQTILLLRIAVTLRDRFHLELQAHRQVLTSLHTSLRTTSFVSLWGKSLAIDPDQCWSWIDDADFGAVTGDAIVVRLSPHLDALSQDFALPRPSRMPGQLDLFPARPVAGPPPPTAAPAPHRSQATQKRRRSA
ncbi:MerR family transcriptional regulator [Parvibaculum sp.]|uniref:MerR family transcriptional regulator n=2 Tax=Parvibaculum sp. TaxID=2024848 RepID=UPI0027320570|nr:MerR family transcriptional regulator [Parvibaculum sp.]MDP2148554.1 MerR family transcriptional regulator [Parvibaculum sp.]MDP3327511.1 MerR family transcriptional regulator [Parvibaculum sp.]